MKKTKQPIAVLLVIAVLASVVALCVNYYVIFSQNDNIISVNDASEKTDFSYILVLGCGVIDGEPSALLEDRLLRALEVAEGMPDVKLIVSGNNSGEEYNEVGVMKSYCISKGFDEKRIICDDYGFSTGESITNFYKNFGVEKVIIVTQRYHLYRALHIASRYGIEAFGVASNQRQYRMQVYYSLREVAARNKDFLKYLIT